MSEKSYQYEEQHAPEQGGDIEIADLRHSRELEEAAAAPAPPGAAPPGQPATQPAAATPPAPEPGAAPEVEAEIGMPEEGRKTDAAPPGGEAEFEMEQLRMLFGGGLSAYLRSQLGLLFNFALIALGRMANPASGIVSVDVDKARLAIDVFEFLVAKLHPELSTEERTEMVNLLAELKYLFMQQRPPAPPPT
jgi:hypothetical protein